MNQTINAKPENLALLAIGEEGKVIAIKDRGAVSRRLMEMGVVPGVSVKVVRTAPFGCPMEIRVRGYNLALRRAEAEAIEIQS